MFKLIKPVTHTSSLLNDPRSTGAPPRPRLENILGLRGTKRG